MKTTTTIALATAGLLAASGAHANLLTNPGFESGGVGSLAGWGTFGNSFADETVSQSAPGSLKMFGTFPGAGSEGVSGVFQEFSATPGDTFVMDAFSQNFSGDAMQAENFVLMRIAFFDAAAEIADSGQNGEILTASSPFDTWIDNDQIMATAPLGTTRVQALFLFIQPDGISGGAGFVDDAFFDLANDPVLPGDANGDGVVNLADFGILRANFGSTMGTFATGDFNGDMLVNLADFGILRANFGSSNASDVAALDAWYATVVPEPASLALAGMSGLALLRRRR